MPNHAPSPTITVVGVGPGDPDYVTIKVRTLIETADVVAGFTTVLNVVSAWIQGDRVDLDYKKQDALLAQLAEDQHLGKTCVVCAYGDLTFSANELLDRVRRYCGELVLVPGISSVQVACARAGLQMQDTLFITLHARYTFEKNKAELIAALHSRQRHVIALPSPWDVMPPDIARLLLAESFPGNTAVSVYQNLTLPTERALHTTLQALSSSETKFSDLSILVFPCPKAS